MQTQFDKPSLDDVYAAIESGNSLEHYGMPRRSGRYPWGSGDDPYQHRRDFLGRVEELKKKGKPYFNFLDKGVAIFRELLPSEKDCGAFYFFWRTV